MCGECAVCGVPELQGRCILRERGGQTARVMSESEEILCPEMEGVCTGPGDPGPVEEDKAGPETQRTVRGSDTRPGGSARPAEDPPRLTFQIPRRNREQRGALPLSALPFPAPP